MEHQTDCELVALARTGHRHAFGQLIERYQQMVKHIVVRMIANDEIARELVQEVMLQAYLSLDHLRDNTRFKSWLYGITLNVCRSHLREQKMNVLSLEALLGGTCGNLTAFLDGLDVVDPQVIAEERELYCVVLQAVQSLSPKDRAATLMFYYSQLSLQEIAAILGVSVVAVKGRLHRARKQLRERLSPEFAGVQPQMRRKTMIKMLINSVRVNTNTQQRVIILQDETGRRVLNIWIGEPEAFVIASTLTNTPMPRPMTTHLTANLLKATGVELEEVQVVTLKDEIFYAVVKVRNGNAEQELDARPSDALALAVLMDRPIYVAEEVMKQAGMVIPEGRALRQEKDQEAMLNIIEERREAQNAALERFRCATPEQRAAAEQSFIELFTDEIPG